MAEEEERRFVITGSVCLDKFIVDTDLLSASTNKEETRLKLIHFYVEKTENGGRERERERERHLSLKAYSSLFQLDMETLPTCC